MLEEARANRLEGKYDVAHKQLERLLVSSKDNKACAREVIAELNRLSSEYLSDKNIQQSEAILKEAVEAARNRFGEDSLEYAKLLIRLGEIWVQQNRFSDAARIGDQAIPVFEKKEKNRADLISAITWLADIECSRCKYEDAQNLYERIATLQKPLSRDYIDTRMNVECMNYRLGKLEKAETILNECLEMKCKQTEKSDDQHAQILSSLAEVCRAQGRRYRAKSLIEAALRITENQKDELKIAEVLVDVGRINFDEKALARALRIREKHLGKYHPLVAYTLEQLWELLIGKHRLQEAQQLEKRRNEIHSFAQSTGTDVNTLLSMAKLECNALRYKQAEKLLKRVLKIRELETNDPFTAVANVELGDIYLLAHKNPEAEQFYKRAFEIWKQRYSENDGYMTDIRTHLWWCYKWQQKEKEAGTLLEMAITNPGSSSLRFRRALRGVALKFNNTKPGCEKTREIMLAALAVQEQRMPPDDAGIIDSLEIIGSVCELHKCYADAEKWYEQAISKINESGNPKLLMKEAILYGHCESLLRIRMHRTQEAKAWAVLARRAWARVNMLSDNERSNLEY